MHNLPFSAADHLSELLPSMFPDSKIAADFSCKRTKTKAIICDALEPNISGLLHLTCFVMNQMREVILLNCSQFLLEHSIQLMEWLSPAT